MNNIFQEIDDINKKILKNQTEKEMLENNLEKIFKYLFEDLENIKDMGLLNSNQMIILQELSKREVNSLYKNDIDEFKNIIESFNGILNTISEYQKMLSKELSEVISIE